MIKDLTKKQKQLLAGTSIAEEFKALFDSISFEDRLSSDIFGIINKYISCDMAGLFFNESDESSRNVFNLSLPNRNITLATVEDVREEFFDVMEKYKRINEIQCNLITGDIVEKSKVKRKSFKTWEIITFQYNDKLSGGLLVASSKKLKLKEQAYLELIRHELNVIMQVKYMFNEQKRFALTDPMTGLYTRQEFDNMLELEFHKARRYIFNFSLAILDIDYLSKINEEYGKEFGDFVLTDLSNLLKRVFRRTDPIYRYGSEEIVVFLPFTPITKAIIPIERLRSAIAGYVFEKDDIKTNITVSIGLCANYSQFTEPGQMLEKLGEALKKAKDGGRNKVDIFE